MTAQSAPVSPWDFTRVMQAAGLIENRDDIVEIKIIAKPDELVTIQVTYLADQRVLTLASPPADDGARLRSEAERRKQARIDGTWQP